MKIKIHWLLQCLRCKEFLYFISGSPSLHDRRAVRIWGWRLYFREHSINLNRDVITFNIVTHKLNLTTNFSKFKHVVTTYNLVWTFRPECLSDYFRQFTFVWLLQCLRCKEFLYFISGSPSLHDRRAVRIFEHFLKN
jgi:hypothetical protein